MALISQSEALVWTDSRYFLQAPKQLTEGWHMKKMMKAEPTWFDHIASNYKKEDTVIGIDARLISAGN
jgi:Xaa-Pro aminopeptidase